MEFSQIKRLAAVILIGTYSINLFIL